MWNSTRLFYLLLGLGSMWWSTTVLPILHTAAPAHEIVLRIIDGQHFQRGVLEEALGHLQSRPRYTFERSETLRALALMEAGATEEAVQRISGDELSRRLASVEKALKNSLFANPSDSFLWLMLYSAETSRNGFAVSNLRYIDQSYLSGPLEGWISLRRNRVALAAFASLRPTTQECVISEFTKMVDSNLIEQAAVNISAAQPALKDRLLSGLNDVDLANKEALGRRLFDAGVQFKIPGVEVGVRPWQR